MGKPRSNSSELIAQADEWREQVAVFSWAEIAKASYPELEMLIGSLNGVRLSIGSAVKAARAGLKRGYPDIALDVPRSLILGRDSSFGGGFRIYCGLRIELKRSESGKLKPEQVRWIELLRANSYRAVACWGAKAAISEIESYLALPKWG
jgi:hypothetical protein